MEFQRVKGVLDRVGSIVAGCHAYTQVEVSSTSVMLRDVKLCVKYVLSDRLRSAHVLVQQQREVGIGFDEAFKFQFGNTQEVVFPIILENGPSGVFCLDGSHRLVALAEAGVKCIDVVMVTPLQTLLPPAKLFEIGDVEAIHHCNDWRDRFIDFEEHRFRPVAGAIDRLCREIVFG